jgi:ABC-type nickel/cobalt efflux system permease component RcnA
MLARRFLRLCALLLLTGLCRSALAHPMGNFSVNHYSKIDLRSDRLVVRYFIDLAEIPTYQELQQGDIPATSVDPNAAVVVRYVAGRGAELMRGLILEIDGKQIPLRMVSSGVIFPPGAGGLPTMKMGFVYEAAYPPKVDRQNINLRYGDNNYPGHTGWKEIVTLASGGSLLHSSVPATDRSGELSNYPTDLLTSPPQNLEASLTAKLPPLPAAVAEAKAHSAHEAPQQTGDLAAHAAHLFNHSKGEAAAAAHPPAAMAPVAIIVQPSQPATTASTTMHLQANRQRTPRSKFTELIAAQHLSAWFLFTAAFIAIGLGGLHALEPGHGKTIVAAYLVGSKGTARHAVLLGIIVTVSHTAGVFALGAITLYASRYILPEQLYPWLGAFSGITIAGLGLYMLLRRITGTATDHSHAPEASHALWMFWKRPTDVQVEGVLVPGSANKARSVSLTQLFTLGITGGIIPCPAALIVLLSAFALHRIGLGFFLIVAFSVGLAVVLIGFGMLMVYARRFMTRLQVDGPLTRRWLPAASSAFITILGLVMTLQAFSSMRIQVPSLSGNQIGPVLLVSGLGLILGMRHSTDADHVVAISTIVSKQRSIRSAAFIGSVWGLGHTITIVVVGSLIILFGVEIPPRLGLSMEFSVALMLILLGLLNLTGVMQKVTAYFTPASDGSAPSGKAVVAREGKTTIERLHESSVGRFGWYQCLRPLAIGLVHGLAGSAAVALLVLSTIHNPVWATVYLFIFGAGTMVGMMCMTTAIALPLAYAGDRFSLLSRYLGVASGMVSLCFGTFLVYHLGFVGGLFTGHPQWTPQ